MELLGKRRWSLAYAALVNCCVYETSKQQSQLLKDNLKFAKDGSKFCQINFQEIAHTL